MSGQNMKKSPGKGGGGDFGDPESQLLSNPSSRVPETQAIPSPRRGCSVISVQRNENEPLLLSSPARKRSRAVISNLSSSSLKKRTNKSSHCKFCPRYKCRTTLEEHFKLSDTCLQLYCRELKVRNIDAVLVKCFPCLGCNKVGNFKLAVHLSKNESCLRVYRERFAVEDVRYIAKKLKTLTRQSNTSRQSLSRRLENEKARDHKKETQTLSEAMNEFKQRTALSNYRLCCKCHCSFLESATREVDPKSQEFVELNLLEKLELRRMNKFFICEFCCNRKDKPSSPESVQENLFNQVSHEGISTLVPQALGTHVTEDPLKNGGVDTIQIPTNLISLNLFKQKNISQPSDITRIIYKCEAAPSGEDVSSLYIDRIMKFKRVRDHYDRVTGTIEDQRQRMLSSIKPIVDQSNIHSSDAWEEAKSSGIKSRFHQFGPVSVSFSCEISPSNIETVATTLIISGKKVTVTFEGDQNYDLKTRYYIHEHPASTDCPGESCKKVDLEDVIANLGEPEIDSSRSKFNSSFICSVYQKTQALVESLIKSKAFDFHSKEFFVGIKFTNDGNAVIEGSLWCQECVQLNDSLSKSSLSGVVTDESRGTFLEFLDKTIHTSPSGLILQSKLNLTDKKADSLSLKAFKHQVNLESRETQMVGFETAFAVKPAPEAERNISSSRKFVEIIGEKLIVLSTEDKLDSSTHEWFDFLQEQFDITDNENSICISIGGRQLIFVKDVRMVGLIMKFGLLKGIYQYSVTCSDNDCGAVILKGERLSSFFTLPFNPSLLSVFDCRTKVSPVFGFEDYIMKSEDKVDTNRSFSSEIEAATIESHKAGPIVELYALADARKIRDICSSPVEFVDCSKDPPEKFKFVKERTDYCFELDGSDGYFEPLSSNVQRHQSRINGSHLILAETCLNYDFVGRSESEKFFEIYGDKISKIPRSEVQSIYENEDGAKVMPTYILCRNKQVLKLRKTKKVLQYREFILSSPEHKRSKVMLFFPISPGSNLTSNLIGKSL